MSSTNRIMAAIDATWPPVEFRQAGPWLLRRGTDGGQRVSACSTTDPAPPHGSAEQGMRAWGQHPLFRLTPDQVALDQNLANAGYEIRDPVALYSAPVTELSDGRDETVQVFRAASPLAMIDEIWSAGGIGAGRRAVMKRVQGPHITLMTRADDRPIGVAFVAVDGDIAMIHAIEVATEHRRKGGGGLLLRGAASFAAEHGAVSLALAVTEANTPARNLYERLGMALVGGYHYRIAPK